MPNICNENDKNSEFEIIKYLNDITAIAQIWIKIIPPSVIFLLIKDRIWRYCLSQITDSKLRAICDDHFLVSHDSII